MALGYMFADRHRADTVFRSQMTSQSAVMLTIANLYGAPNNLYKVSNRRFALVIRPHRCWSRGVQ